MATNLATELESFAAIRVEALTRHEGSGQRSALRDSDYNDGFEGRIDGWSVNGSVSREYGPSTKVELTSYGYRVTVTDSAIGNLDLSIEAPHGASLRGAEALGSQFANLIDAVARVLERR